MRFLLALLFAYIIALIGASVYAHPASDIVKRGTEAPNTVSSKRPGVMCAEKREASRD